MPFVHSVRLQLILKELRDYIALELTDVLTELCPQPQHLPEVVDNTRHRQQEATLSALVLQMLCMRAWERGVGVCGVEARA